MSKVQTAISNLSGLESGERDIYIYIYIYILIIVPYAKSFLPMPVWNAFSKYRTIVPILYGKSRISIAISDIHDPFED